MINPTILLKLKTESPVVTEGGDTTADRLVGTRLDETDFVYGEPVEAYTLLTPNGGYTVAKSYVAEIVEL